MIRGLEDWAEKNNIEVTRKQPTKPTQPRRECTMQLKEKDGPPMMFRAQIAGRCSLQFASEPEHLEQWKKELIRPASDTQPCYLHDNPETLQKDDRLYQIQVKFPYRLCSNSGQDSIFRPVLGKNGIPILPGSSVKGAFRNACRHWDKTHGTQVELKYCGTTEKPGALRFHNAYPVGDWSNRMVDVVHSQQDWQVGKHSSTHTEPVTQPPPAPPRPQPAPPPIPPAPAGNQPNLNRPPIRPTPPLNRPPARPIPRQQPTPPDRNRNRNGNRQEQNNPGKSAVALISLYQPTMIFEFSRGRGTEEIDWSEVERLLNLALDLGIGGKTSTGYGYGSKSKPDYARNNNSNRDRYNLALHIPLEGTGVISKLLGQESEFRPNMFKASLRGHFRRLLAGVCSDNAIVEREADRWFGCTDSEGIVKLFWELSQSPENRLTHDKRDIPHNASKAEREKEELLSQTYAVDGTLHLDAPEAERELLRQVFQFAYIMGGFGKSWRRVAHSEFYSGYPQRRGKFHIGCHWQSSDTENWLQVKSKDQLTEFLKGLHQRCKNQARDLGTNANSPLNWREAWHLERVAVYANEVSKSQVIRLFHQEPEHPFKSTPAICGKKLVKRNGQQQFTRNGKPKTEFVVSSVWHRMLPISDNRYLEIVTVFHGDRSQWYSNGKSQLKLFTEELAKKNMERVWGNL